jgi:hypothetical protein
MKNETACKGLKLLADGDTLLLGLESGVIKVINRHTLMVLNE